VGGYLMAKMATMRPKVKQISSPSFRFVMAGRS
jgi:hypothetical protein